MWNPIKQIADWWNGQATAGSESQPTEDADHIATQEPRKLWDPHPDPIKDRMWVSLSKNECPHCGSTTYISACGGAAVNMVCEQCEASYWWSEIRAFGADVMREPRVQNRLIREGEEDNVESN